MNLFKRIHSPVYYIKNVRILATAIFAAYALVASLLPATWFTPRAIQPFVSKSRVSSSSLSDNGLLASVSQGASQTFIENVGQFDRRIRFQMRSGNKTFFLTNDALWVTLVEPQLKSDLAVEAEVFDAVEAKSEVGRQVNVKLRFVDANTDFRLEPFDRSQVQVSFLKGNNPANWYSDVPAWGSVRYVDLYPGIDLEITSRDGQLSQRLIVREPSSLSRVRLRIEGVDIVTLQDNYLHLTTGLGNIILPLLTIEGSAPRVKPALSLVDEAYQVSAPFASTSPLVVNATLPGTTSMVYSTYLGGSDTDQAYDIALDDLGNVYIVGQTSSVDFPLTLGSYDVSYNDTADVFVSKLSADGSTLLYSTYLGGGNRDDGTGIVVDDTGNAFITGSSWSPDFPVTPDALDTTLSGGRDAFVTKLNAAGDTLIYSTYLGGNNWDYGHCIAIDNVGNAYVGGFTHGSFPVTLGAAQTIFGGSGDGFATKINPDGDTLLYSTYLGGISWEAIDGIAIDSAGNAYLASHTHSVDFPTTPGAWDRTCDNCQTNVSTDGAVAKLNSAGSAFVYSTLIGGADVSGVESFADVAIDGAGNAYLTGRTSSNDFPTTGDVLQPGFGNGGYDAVAVKLNAEGSDLLYSTYLGGSGVDVGLEIITDIKGNAYITGYTSSTDLAMVNPFQANNAGGYDVFVVKVNGEGSALLYGTYLGGSGNENCHTFPHGYSGIAMDSIGNIYLTGFTDSSDFPTTTDAYDASFNGGMYDAFVVSLDFVGVKRLFLPMIFAQ